MARFPSPTAATGSFDGADAVVLRAGDYEFVAVPEVGMLGASLTFAGAEYVSLHGGLDAYRHHHTTGVPLLHPWANRLATSSYTADGIDVRFDPLPPVSLANGLPIHGTMAGASGWVVEALEATTAAAAVQARYHFGQHPQQLRSFPFPHDLVVRYELTDDGLCVTTTIHATGLVGVPVSFGWHPYFVLPGVGRDDLAVVLPEREHLELDEKMLPTGASSHEPMESLRLGRAPNGGPGVTTFDDAYLLAADVAPHTLAIEHAGPPHLEEAGGMRLEIEIDGGYPFAQVYAPSESEFVALEPMTAGINALVTGDHRTVAPGETYAASFTIRVTPAPPAAD